MDKLEVDDVARLILTASDISGALVDPGNLRLYIKSPSGVQTMPTVSRDSIGAFHADVNLSESGIYLFLWKSDSPYKGVVDGEFIVSPNIFEPI